jgi:hypothetical protein
MNAGRMDANGEEIYVDIGSIETGRVPGDIDRCGIVERLGCSRGLVEPANIASYEGGCQMRMGEGLLPLKEKHKRKVC